MSQPRIRRARRQDALDVEQHGAGLAQGLDAGGDARRFVTAGNAAGGAGGHCGGSDTLILIAGRAGLLGVDGLFYQCIVAVLGAVEGRARWLWARHCGLPRRPAACSQ